MKSEPQPRKHPLDLIGGLGGMHSTLKEIEKELHQSRDKIINDQFQKAVSQHETVIRAMGKKIVCIERRLYNLEKKQQRWIKKKSI